MSTTPTKVMLVTVAIRDSKKTDGENPFEKNWDGIKMNKRCFKSLSQIFKKLIAGWFFVCNLSGKTFPNEETGWFFTKGGVNLGEPPTRKPGCNHQRGPFLLPMVGRFLLNFKGQNPDLGSMELPQVPYSKGCI